MSLSGVMPWDLAGLTVWQLEHDFIRPMNKLIAQAKRGGDPEPEPMTRVPTKIEHISALSRFHPEWTQAQWDEDYAKFAAMWEAAGEKE